MAGSSTFFLTLNIQAQDQYHAEAIRQRIGQVVETLHQVGDPAAPFVCRLGSLTAVEKEIRGAFGKIKPGKTPEDNGSDDQRRPQDGPSTILQSPFGRRS